MHARYRYTPPLTKRPRPHLLSHLRGTGAPRMSGTDTLHTARRNAAFASRGLVRADPAGLETRRHSRQSAACPSPQRAEKAQLQVRKCAPAADGRRRSRSRDSISAPRSRSPAAWSASSYVARGQELRPHSPLRTSPPPQKTQLYPALRFAVPAPLPKPIGAPEFSRALPLFPAGTPLVWTRRRAKASAPSAGSFRRCALPPPEAPATGVPA